MVLASFGCRESLERIRLACEVSRDGISAAAIVQAAGRFGLHAEAYRVEPDDLAALPLPQILYWNFNHFVVLDAADRSSFVINDPATGRRRIGLAEMDRSFTGITIAFQTTPGFRRVRSATSIVATLWTALAGARGAVASIILGTILLTCIGIAVPSVTRIFVDDYLSQGRSAWLPPLLGGIIVLAATRGGLVWINAQLGLFLQTRINAAMSSRLVWTLLRLPFPFIASRSAAEISTRMGLAGQIAGIASGPFLKTINTAIMVFGYGLAMVAYSRLLTLLVLIVTSANLAILLTVNRAVADAASDAQMAAGKAHAATMRGIAVLEESRATGMVPLLYRRLMNAYVQETNAQQRSQRVAQRLGTVPFFCANLLSLVVLAAGSYQVMRAELTLGGMLAFQMLAELFAAPLTSIVGLGSAILSVSGGVARTDDLLGGNPRATAPADAAPFAGQRLSGAIAIEGMRFAYGGKPPLFDGLSLAVAPGEMVLIQGVSGAGKTTLAMLLTGILAPETGQIRLDGQDYATIPAETLRYSIGLADHTPFFAASSLRDALGLWDPAVTTSALRDALHDAMMDEAVMGRPGGLDGRIGEAGLGFSGGELQRLGFARALVQAPSILIVDDATTALDPQTEQALLANLRRRKITTVMLGSRPLLAPHFDRVLTIEAGRLVAGA